jgi:hypothetical protein
MTLSSELIGAKEGIKANSTLVLVPHSLVKPMIGLDPCQCVMACCVPCCHIWSVLSKAGSMVRP